MPAFLRGDHGAARLGARDLFSAAAGGLLRGHWERARDRVAGWRFAVYPGVRGDSAGRGCAGSYDRLADAATDRFGDTSASLRLGPWIVSRWRFGEGQANRD